METFVNSGPGFSDFQLNMIIRMHDVDAGGGAGKIDLEVSKTSERRWDMNCKFLF